MLGRELYESASKEVLVCEMDRRPEPVGTNAGDRRLQMQGRLRHFETLYQTLSPPC
jgi:hypothetical protein